MSKEILSVIESVSHEKGVPQDIIFGAMEAALAMATKKKYSEEAEFRVAIDRETGEYETFRTWAVVDFDNLEEEEEPNPAAQYSVEQAQEIKTDAQLGDVLEEQVESVEFGRIAAQTAKQVIVQKVREAERAQIVEMYQSRINDLISGTVKKLGRESVIIDLGNNARRFGLWDSGIDWQDIFRSPNSYLEGLASDVEIERQFKYIMPDDVRERFAKTENVLFNMKEVYVEITQAGGRPKDAIFKAIEHHVSMCEENSEDVFDALELADLLDHDIEYRVKQYSHCISKNTENYVKWLIEDYKRKLQFTLRQNM